MLVYYLLSFVLCTEYLYLAQPHQEIPLRCNHILQTMRRPINFTIALKQITFFCLLSLTFRNWPPGFISILRKFRWYVPHGFSIIPFIEPGSI